MVIDTAPASQPNQIISCFLDFALRLGFIAVWHDSLLLATEDLGVLPKVRVLSSRGLLAHSR